MNFLTLRLPGGAELRIRAPCFWRAAGRNAVGYCFDELLPIPTTALPNPSAVVSFGAYAHTCAARLTGKRGECALHAGGGS